MKARYLLALKSQPLATKAATAAVLSLLNESIASCVSAQTLIVPFSTKMVLMLLYGGGVSTPISHYMYMVLNRLVRPSTRKGKVTQLILQLTTIAPLLATLMIGYITWINSTKFNWKLIKKAIRENLLRMWRTNCGLNLFNMIIAQNWLPQDLWVSFFTFTFFILGTYQNTMLKLKMRS